MIRRRNRFGIGWIMGLVVLATLVGCETSEDVGQRAVVPEEPEAVPAEDTTAEVAEERIWANPYCAPGDTINWKTYGDSSRLSIKFPSACGRILLEKFGYSPADGAYAWSTVLESPANTWVTIQGANGTLEMFGYQWDTSENGGELKPCYTHMDARPWVQEGNLITLWCRGEAIFRFRAYAWERAYYEVPSVLTLRADEI